MISTVPVSSGGCSIDPDDRDFCIAYGCGARLVLSSEFVAELGVEVS